MWVLSGYSENKSVPDLSPSFKGLVTILGIPQFADTSLQTVFALPPLGSLPFTFPTRTVVIGFRAYPNPG